MTLKLMDKYFQRHASLATNGLAPHTPRSYLENEACESSVQRVIRDARDSAAVSRLYLWQVCPRH